MMQINYEELVKKFQTLYPTEFNHVVAEVRGDKLEAELQETHELLAQSVNDSDYEQDTEQPEPESKKPKKEKANA